MASITPGASPSFSAIGAWEFHSYSAPQKRAAVKNRQFAQAAGQHAVETEMDAHSLNMLGDAGMMQKGGEGVAHAVPGAVGDGVKDLLLFGRQGVGVEFG